MRRYEVAFEDEDGSELKDAISYPYGTQPEDIAVPETPSKSPTKSEVYTFAGWNLKAVTGNVTYRATYTVSPRLYTITFESADGAVLESADYAYGTPTSDINLPTAPINSGFKFAGWTPEVATVTEDVTYKPHYVPNDEFVVTWRDEDGTLLHTENYAAGQIPSYDGTPTKESTAQYDYTFNGWTPAIAAVSGDVEYKATYKGTVRKYTVLFVNEDGSPLGTAKDLEVAHKRRCSWKGGYDCDGWLGVGVTLSSGGTPVDLSQCNAIQYDYRGSEHIFKVESVLDVDYNSVRTYVDSSENWKTVTIYLNKLKYGTVDADVAFKQAKQFIWSDMMGEGIFELDNIKCLHKPTYVAKFYYGENLIDSVMVAEGDEPEYDGAFSLDSVAEEMSDDKFEYVVDWTPEIVPATKDVAYTATFTKQPRKFWISFSTAKDWSDIHLNPGGPP